VLWNNNNNNNNILLAYSHPQQCICTFNIARTRTHTQT